MSNIWECGLMRLVFPAIQTRSASTVTSRTDSSVSLPHGANHRVSTPVSAEGSPARLLCLKYVITSLRRKESTKKDSSGNNRHVQQWATT